MGTLVRFRYNLWLPVVGETYSLTLAPSRAIGLVGLLSIPLCGWSVFTPPDELPLKFFLLFVGIALQLTTRSVSLRGRRKTAAWIMDDLRALGHQISEPVVCGNTKDFKDWLVREKIHSAMVRQAGRIRLERSLANTPF